MVGPSLNATPNLTVIPSDARPDADEDEPPSSGNSHNLHLDLGQHAHSDVVTASPSDTVLTLESMGTPSPQSPLSLRSPPAKGGDHPDRGAPDMHQPHTLTTQETIALFTTDSDNGLTSQEATKRLASAGPNELAEIKGASAFTIFLRQCANALTVVLIGAMALSFGVQDWVEGGVVAAVIICNVGIGFIQEFKAERMMASLRSLSAPTANVRRDGEVITVPSRELVTGDIVLFRAGDVLPADVRILALSNLEIDEAALTGESLPVAKETDALCDLNGTLGVGDRTNCGFASTTVSKGRGTGIVFATASDTQIGIISAIMASKATKDMSVVWYKRWWELMAKWLGLREGTPLQIRLNKLAYILLGLAVICAVIVFAVAEFDINNEVILYAIALAIGVIPESLVAVLTIAFSVGASRLAKSRVIVRRLEALEALGGVDNICTDKTGTITSGKMSLATFWTPATDGHMMEGLTYGVEQSGATPFEPTGRVFTSTADKPAEPIQHLDVASLPSNVHSLATAASLCNIAELFEKDGVWCTRGEPTEIALLVFAAKLGFRRQDLLESEKPQYKTVAEWPFDSSIKRMTVAADHGAGRTLYMKGAVERVLACCSSVGGVPLDDDGRTRIIERMEKMASGGYRVLALAQRDGVDLATEVDKAAKGELQAVARDVVEQDFAFGGLVGIYDPPRPESRDAVLACKGAGISVRMLSGDNHLTCRAIARQVGILDGTEGSSAVMTAAEFEALSDAEVDALPNLPLVVARCSPGTKVAVLRAGQRRGGHYAMTGDGINDCPSLKIADIGIAMGSGTDVAKDVSDLVLTDSNFGSIAQGVREGRTVADNIQKFLIALLVANVGEVLLLLVGLAFRDARDDSVFPLSPIEILFANLLFGFPAIGLGLEKADDMIMRRPPRDLKQGVFSRAVIVDIFFYGFTMGWTCLVAFVVMIYGVGDGTLGFDCNGAAEGCDVVFHARSAVFTALILQNLLIAWEMVSMDRSFVSRAVWTRLGDNPTLLWSVLLGAVTIPICLYVPKFNTDVFRHAPLHGIGWAVAIAATLAFLATVEVWKCLARRGRWAWLARVSGTPKESIIVGHSAEQEA